MYKIPFPYSRKTSASQELFMGFVVMISPRTTPSPGFVVRGAMDLPDGPHYPEEGDKAKRDLKTPANYFVHRPKADALDDPVQSNPSACEQDGPENQENAVQKDEKKMLSVLPSHLLRGVPRSLVRTSRLLPVWTVTPSSFLWIV